MDQRSAPLTRAQIAEFIGSDRGVRTFEALQIDTGALFDALTNAQFLTLAADPSLGSERVFTPVAGELTGTDGGANGAYSLGLADTTVVPATYGDSTGLVRLVIDQKGRVTGAQSYSLGSGLEFAAGSVRAKSAGTYGAPTGTLSRTTFATYTAPTVGAAYVQAEVQAIANALQTVSRTLAALITDLRTNGNLS